MGFFNKPRPDTVVIGVANDEAVKFFESVIAEHGCFCAADEVTMGNGQATMATHTVGLADKGWPELMLVGIDPQVAAQVLNKIIAQRDTPFKVGDVIEGVATTPMRLDPISDEAIERFMGQAIAMRLAHGGRDIEALQLIFTDSAKRWPEDEGYDKAETAAQVLLKDWRGN